VYQSHLKAAGIAYDKDAQGRHVDFHSLRHTLATNLARGGVAPRVAMEMMRHSEMRLTMSTYTDAALLPMADALDRLPSFEVIAVQQKAAVGCQNAAGMGTQKGTQNVVREGQNLSAEVKVPSPLTVIGISEKSEQSHEKSAEVAGCPEGEINGRGRIRTYEGRATRFTVWPVWPLRYTPGRTATWGRVVEY
jgi:hypothetical protein